MDAQLKVSSGGSPSLSTGEKPVAGAVTGVCCESFKWRGDDSFQETSLGQVDLSFPSICVDPQEASNIIFLSKVNVHCLHALSQAQMSC